MPGILNQALFHGALLRQQKQAERFEEPFGLLLLSFNSQPPPHLARTFEALRRSTLDRDIVGWFEEGVVVGIIRSAADLDPNASAASIQAATERELARHLTTSDSSSYRVSVEICSALRGTSGAHLATERNVRKHTGEKFAGRAVKRALDIAGSMALLALLSPVLLIVSALVKITSKGPVFFRQERIGERGRPFLMLKFRTMHVNAGHDLHEKFVSQYIQGQQNTASSNAQGPIFKIVGDPRVTRIGHFLRRSSLDELPQFWNVLKGEMSLVGPRPPLAYEVKVYKPWHRRRVLEAKPGITGLWQVTGRSRTTFDEMVRLDIRYARQQSIWVDFKILLATPRAVISGKGAH